MIPKTTAHWLKALLAAAITGGANAGLSIAGIAAGQAAGIQVTQLNGRQMVAAVVSGAIVGTLAYLKQSPVPPEDGPEQLQIPIQKV